MIDYQAARMQARQAAFDPFTPEEWCLRVGREAAAIDLATAMGACKRMFRLGDAITRTFWTVDEAIAGYQKLNRMIGEAYYIALGCTGAGLGSTSFPLGVAMPPSFAVDRSLVTEGNWQAFGSVAICGFTDWIRETVESELYPKEIEP